MTELTEPMKSFLRAQRKRIEAHEKGEYELDPDEGFRCSDCDWSGLSAPMSNSDSDSLLQCPECGSDNLKSGDIKVEYYQEFGYEFEKMPGEIPSNEVEDHRM